MRNKTLLDKLAYESAERLVTRTQPTVTDTPLIRLVSVNQFEAGFEAAKRMALQKIEELRYANDVNFIRAALEYLGEEEEDV